MLREQPRQSEAGLLDDCVTSNQGHLLVDAADRGELKRHACWMESLGVGSRAFVEQVQPRISGCSETPIAMRTDKIWALHEPGVPYGQETGPKSVRKATRQR
jgi:hypothetical protein